MKKDVRLSQKGQEESPLWERFFNRKVGVLLLFALLFGVVCGCGCATMLALFQDRWVLPLQFSGMPVNGSGFVSCFSTLLLNALTGLIPLFLLGITAFGVFAVPLFLVFRGMTVGIGISYFLWRDELFGLLQSALIYTPAAAATGVLLLLFAVRSFQFSSHMAKASFSSQQGGLDLKLYFYDLLLFCSFSVGISLLGSLLASVYFLFV